MRCTSLYVYDVCRGHMWYTCVVCAVFVCGVHIPVCICMMYVEEWYVMSVCASV